MSNQVQTGIQIGDWHVTPDEGVLRRGDEVVHLEPKVMEVLVYFASRPGKVISREELEREVWKGALVGYDAVSKTIIKLRKALQDDARAPRYIATIAKKGYQLTVPVHLSERPTHAIQDRPPPDLPLQKRHAVIVALALLIVLAIVGWWMHREDSTKPEVPVVMVLPFENLDENQQHEMFVDGMTEDVITDLSKISGLQVLASNAAFQYKGQDITSQQLRQDLGVDYVLKGSIRRQAKTLRVNIQVIDARTNINVWAERYDRKLDEAFAVQNELTQGFVNQIALKLSSHEKQQLMTRATTNMAAYDHFLSGQRLSRQMTRETNAQAREAYRLAIKIDPSYSRAYGGMAYTLALDYRFGWTDTPLETLDRALSLAEQATLLETNIPQTYWVLGYVHLMRKEYGAAAEAVTNAIRIAPNYADGYGLLSLINNSLGKPEEAIQYVTKGMKLNPYYTWDYPYNLGRAYYLLGKYDSAINALEKAQVRNENAEPIKLFLAASYVRAGRFDDAQWTTEQLQIINPSATISHTAKTIPIARKDLKTAFLEDLRKAGLPE